MKKKILIFTLLFMLLLGLGVPDQAEAAQEKYYSVTDFLDSYGYDPFVEKENCVYLVEISSDYMNVHEFQYVSNRPVLAKFADNNYIYFLTTDSTESVLTTYTYYSPEVSVSAQNYSLYKTTVGVNSSLCGTSRANVNYNGAEHSLFRLNESVENVLYSCENIYIMQKTGSSTSSPVEVLFNNVIFESSVPGYYTFMDWCVDAGLSNPSGHTFNSDYYYLVTYNSIGYFVTQIYTDESIKQFTELVSYDNKLYLHLKDDISGTSIFVNRFNYINGKWSNVGTEFFTLDYGELTDLNVTVASNNKLCYSNRSIKTGSTYGNVYYSANTEFTEGFAGEVDPDVRPDVTITPTPTPGSSGGGSSGGDSGNSSSGGSSGVIVGGNAKPGGMLEFIITFFTMVWTKLFAVEVPVDGYNISFQSIVIFGAVAGVLIWLGKISFGKKG